MVWVAVIMLTALFLGSAAESTWVQNRLTSVVDLLDKSEWYVDAGEWEEAEGCVWEAMNIWEESHGALSLFVRQHTLDEGNILLEKAAETLRVRERTRYKIENAALTLFFLQLAEGEQIFFNNLL